MTTAQQLLEAQRRKDIRTIMTDALERRRATRRMVQGCCDDLGVSWGTFYSWAKALNIDVTAYHYVESNGSPRPGPTSLRVRQQQPSP
tara:strand:- start:138 stop:401 length:264 start_codon:yes stop_codon:yes gene_type:complete